MVEPPVFVLSAAERLARAFAAERIVLFGSYAKGTATPDSDVDLLVVARLAGDLAVYQRRAEQLIVDYFPLIDVLMCTPQDLEEARSDRSQFLLSVIDSGVTVYNRSKANETREELGL